MSGESTPVECAYVASTLTKLPFFASKVRLGKQGIVEHLSIGTMNKIETENFEMMHDELQQSIEKGVAFAMAVHA